MTIANSILENKLTENSRQNGPVIKVENLSKHYGRFKAVDNMSFEVPAGALYGFVGPNGAGKTTTIKILATLLEPDSGQVSVGGYDLTRKPAQVRDILGYMPDFFGVYDDLTVTEYLEFYARSQGVKTRNRANLIFDLLALVDLSHKRTDYVNVLSRGMKQRLCLARCLVHDPQVLLLDEPASGLDPHARVEMRELLRELQKMGKTILVSSHILSELAEMCTQIGIVDHGHFLISGTMPEIQRRFGRKHLLRVRLAAPEIPEPKPALTDLQDIDTYLPLLSALWADEPPTQPTSAAPTLAQALERAAAILQTQAGLAEGSKIEIVPENSEVLADFPGTNRQLQAALAALLRAGLPVCGFAVEQSALEDIFLDITTVQKET